MDARNTRRCPIGDLLIRGWIEIQHCRRHAAHAFGQRADDWLARLAFAFSAATHNQITPTTNS
jgi:hypothetical protein